jgi:hypothetical protein
MIKVKQHIDIDLIVDSKPLTKTERELISSYIKSDKQIRSKKNSQARIKQRKGKTLSV